MSFQFDSSGPKRLPVIPVVPDHKLSTIEGRNEIGKTLAARILEFITEGQPFVALPKAWESFGRDLGKLTVTIDGFPGGETVQVRARGASLGRAGRRTASPAEGSRSSTMSRRTASRRRLIRFDASLGTRV